MIDLETNDIITINGISYYCVDSDKIHCNYCDFRKQLYSNEGCTINNFGYCCSNNRVTLINTDKIIEQEKEKIQKSEKIIKRINAIRYIIENYSGDSYIDKYKTYYNNYENKTTCKTS